MGRLKDYRAARERAVAEGRADQELKKLEKDRHAWCPECSFQLFSTARTRVNFCARCGWTKD